MGWSFLALYTPGLHEHQPGVPGAAPVVLAIGNASYGVLYAVASLCAIAILPVRRVR